MLKSPFYIINFSSVNYLLMLAKLLFQNNREIGYV